MTSDDAGVRRERAEREKRSTCCWGTTVAWAALCPKIYSAGDITRSVRDLAVSKYTYIHKLERLKNV